MSALASSTTYTWQILMHTVRHVANFYQIDIISKAVYSQLEPYYWIFHYHKQPRHALYCQQFQWELDTVVFHVDYSNQIEISHII